MHPVEAAAPPVFEEVLQRLAHGAKGDLFPRNFFLGEKPGLDGLVAGIETVVEQARAVEQTWPTRTTLITANRPCIS